MTLGLLSPLMQAFLGVASAVSALTFIEPATACAQDTISPQNACAISDDLKATKTVSGTYTDEATRKGAEGIVALCVTVDGNGEVTDVTALRGPSELFQPSIDAAKQWQFEPPTKSSAATMIEMGYSLTKPCPDGGKGMDVGEVTVNIGTGHSIEGTQGDALEIVGKAYQPLPPYPEKARAESRRGKLYLSIVVDPDGRVVDARIVKSLDELLDKLALDTIRTWRFNVSSGAKATVFPVALNFQIPCLSPVAQEQLSIDSPKVVIDDVELKGATHLPETVKEQLLVSLKQRGYEEDSDWIGDLENLVTRAETDGWPDREDEGYVGFSVGAQWKPIRREPGLLHVSVTIQVDEGKQKRLAKVEFRYVDTHLVPPVFASVQTFGS